MKEGREGKVPSVGPGRLGLLECLKRVARAIVATFGDQCEVVIHDLREPEASIVFIEGNVTGRSIGGPATDLLLTEMRRGTRQEILSYRTHIAGRTLRSSSILFGADDGGPAALCINFDVSDLVAVEDALRSLSGDEATVREDIDETFAQDFTETLETMIAQVAHEMGTRIELMNKDDRVHMVDMLEQRGAFQIKRAVPIVAQWLGVSRATVYNYLNELWAAKRKHRPWVQKTIKRCESTQSKGGNLH